MVHDNHITKNHIAKQLAMIFNRLKKTLLLLIVPLLFLGCSDSDPNEEITDNAYDDEELDFEIGDEAKQERDEFIDEFNNIANELDDVEKIDDQEIEDPREESTCN